MPPRRVYLVARCPRWLSDAGRVDEKSRKSRKPKKNNEISRITHGRSINSRNNGFLDFLGWPSVILDISLFFPDILDFLDFSSIRHHPTATLAREHARWLGWLSDAGGLLKNRENQEN